MTSPPRSPRTPRTPRASTPAAQFAAFLSRFGPEIIALVKRCLPKIRRAVPCTHEIVYNYSNQIVVTFGMSERGYEGIVSLAISPDVVRLYFSKDLPDPKGLLEGSGTKVRSVIIKAAPDLDHADIRALFKSAIALHTPNKRAGVTASKTRSPRAPIMIIKSARPSQKKTTQKKASKKQGPRKTPHA